VTGQLAFDLPALVALKRSDFFVSPVNALALAALDGWRDWPQGKMVLVGPAGAGKTHLAHIWAGETGAALLPATAVAGADLPAFGARGALVVEDADRLAAQGDYAEAVHLLLKRSFGEIAAERPDWLSPASTAREIGALPALPERARSAFSTIAQVVERSLFGLRILAEPDWLRARSAYADFALAGFAK